MMPKVAIGRAERNETPCKKCVARIRRNGSCWLGNRAYVSFSHRANSKSNTEVQRDPGKAMKDIRRIFAEWPSSIPRQGIIVSNFGESLPFCNFMLCGDLILVERKTPDAAGGRRVIMGLDGILAIKIIDAIEMPRFTAMGFVGLA